MPQEPGPALLSNPRFYKNSNHNSGDQILGVHYANERWKENYPFSNSHHQQFENNQNDGPGDQNNGVNYSQRGLQQLLHLNLTSPNLTLGTKFGDTAAHHLQQGHTACYHNSRHDLHHCLQHFKSACANACANSKSMRIWVLSRLCGNVRLPRKVPWGTLLGRYWVRGPIPVHIRYLLLHWLLAGLELQRVVRWPPDVYLGTLDSHHSGLNMFRHTWMSESP
ncbi:hypothetical protein F4680DRAFT_470969 [Xylaria scruposa]|nr:hypothetical protein F4680DRAFT_470969 [Xylaria scruposa]